MSYFILLLVILASHSIGDVYLLASHGLHWPSLSISPKAQIRDPIIPYPYVINEERKSHHVDVTHFISLY